MFEKGKLIPHDFRGEGHESEEWVGSVDAPPARSREALRAIEWSELTARLGAARDLRQELRQDAVLIAGASGASFGDAAESYFKMLGNGERPVNPDGLEGCKASCDTPFDQSGDSALGDARDDT